MLSFVRLTDSSHRPPDLTDNFTQTRRCAVCASRRDTSLLDAGAAEWVGVHSSSVVVIVLWDFFSLAELIPMNWAASTSASTLAGRGIVAFVFDGRSLPASPYNVANASNGHDA